VCTESVHPAQLGFARRDAHPHRQLQLPLRGRGGINRGSGWRELRAHAITGVLEPALLLDRPAEYLVVVGEGNPHRAGIGFLPTG
jgi:hypothetical protein